jgi:hypothetical protein
MKETRKMFADDLRKLCIKKKWYTLGTNNAYAGLMFGACARENVDTQTIVATAKDIIEHSEEEYLMPLPSVCFELAEICHSYFSEDSGEESVALGSR